MRTFRDYPGRFDEIDMVNYWTGRDKYNAQEYWLGRYCIFLARQHGLDINETLRRLTDPANRVRSMTVAGAKAMVTSYRRYDRRRDPPEFPVYIGWDGREHAEF